MANIFDVACYIVNQKPVSYDEQKLITQYLDECCH